MFRRPSYASVTATLALFVALGGSGYAANTLARGSVGTEQLRDGAVTGAKLARGLASTPLGYAHISVKSAPASVCGPHCELAQVDASMSYGVSAVVFAGLTGPHGAGKKIWCVYGSINPHAVAATVEMGYTPLSAPAPQVEIGQAWMIQRCPQSSAGRVVAVVTLPQANAPIRLPSAVGPTTPQAGPEDDDGLWLVFY